MLGIGLREYSGVFFFFSGGMDCAVVSVHGWAVVSERQGSAFIPDKGSCIVHLQILGLFAFRSGSQQLPL